MYIFDLDGTLADTGQDITDALNYAMKPFAAKEYSLEETKASLKRALSTWKERDDLSAKLGKGKFAIVGYDKIKRITIPLRNNHMLFLSVEGDKPEYIKDVLNIVKWVEEHPSQT